MTLSLLPAGETPSLTFAVAFAGIMLTFTTELRKVLTRYMKGPERANALAQRRGRSEEPRRRRNLVAQRIPGA